MNKLKLFQKSEGFSDFISAFLAIAFGLLFGLIIIIASNPSNAVGGFIAMLTGGFDDGLSSFGRVLFSAVPIIMTGLSVGFAFKTGLFNIGTPGQFITGAFVAIWIGIKWTFLPSSIHWLVAMLGGMVMGGIWALIPGIFKAYFNVNEVISSIMMNYIGMYGVNYLVATHIYDTMRAQSLPVASSAMIPKMGMDQVFSGSTANGGILIAILCVILVYVILNKTTFGFELKACGINKDATKYAGINEKRNIVLSIVIAGMLAGLGGALLYLGGTGKYITVVDELAPEGFNGIAVALLGMNNPIGILFAGIFVSYMNYGGFVMQLHGFAPQIVDIIISCIIYFAAFSMMVKLLINQHRLRKAKSEEGGKQS